MANSWLYTNTISDFIQENIVPTVKFNQNKLSYNKLPHIANIKKHIIWLFGLSYSVLFFLVSKNSTYNVLSFVKYGVIRNSLLKPCFNPTNSNCVGKLNLNGPFHSKFWHFQSNQHSSKFPLPETYARW